MTPSRPAAAGTTRGSRQGLLVLAVLALYALLVARFNFLIDDAFISFRYAAHWAAGEGLRYNLGVDPPVEGYSNFLWVCALTLLKLVSIPLELGSRLLSITCGIALVLGLRRLLREHMQLGPAASLLGILFVALFPPFATWSTSGLETLPFTLLLFATYYLCARARSASGTGLALGLCAFGTSLMRVEGIAWVAAIFALCAFSKQRAGGSAPALLRRYSRPLAILLVGYLLFLGGRYLYYGDWVSNTVHAKAVMTTETLVRGLKTVVSYGLTLYSPLFVLAFFPAALRRPKDTYPFVAAMLTLGFLGYNVLVGGDWMSMFRFMVPATPFLAVVLASALARLRPQVALILGSACAATSLLCAFELRLLPRSLLETVAFRSFTSGYQSELQAWRTSRANTRNNTLQGRALGQIAKPGDSIVTGTIGAQGYYSGLFVHDTNGLVTREVALLPATDTRRSAGHMKRVPRIHFIDRAPTYFKPAIVPRIPRTPEAPAFRGNIRQLARSVFSKDPGDEGLREYCLPKIYPLEHEDGFPPQASLLVLEYTDDREAARSYWKRLGL